MKAIVQKVKYSRVTVDDKIVGEINKGFMILLGVTHDDGDKEINWVANKIKDLRIFMDENEKMNLSLADVNGEVLIISQFTLYANCIKGRRPGFTDAARPEKASLIYEKFIQKFIDMGISTQTGIFGADMKVELLNDGPTTIILDTKDVPSLN